MNPAITMPRTPPHYWLDLGNQQRIGQVVIGQPKNRVIGTDPNRLPTVLEENPELLDTTIPEDDQPSCSLAEALERQSLFINRAVTTFALSILENLFRRGGLDYRGAWINLETGHVNPIPVFDQTSPRKGCGHAG